MNTTQGTTNRARRASSGDTPSLRIVQAMRDGILPREYVASVIGEHAAREALHFIEQCQPVDLD